MEHRWSKRFNVNVDVSLYHRGNSVIKCQTHDAGSAGIFIEPVHQALAKNTFLEVEFEQGLNLRYKKPQKFRMRALVVHTSKKGIGLMFLKPEPETLLAWRQEIRRAHHQPCSSSAAINTSSFSPELSVNFLPERSLGKLHK